MFLYQIWFLFCEVFIYFVFSLKPFFVSYFLWYIKLELESKVNTFTPRVPWSLLRAKSEVKFL